MMKLYVMKHGCYCGLEPMVKFANMQQAFGRRPGVCHPVCHLLASDEAAAQS